MDLAQAVNRWFHKTKDSASSFLIEKAVAHALSRYSSMLKFLIDSQKKTAHLEILLKGEPAPLQLVVHEYEVFTEGNRTFIEVRRATASREWVQVVIEDWLLGKRIELPEKYSRMLRMVV